MSNPVKPNTKIKILSPEHSEYVQKLAFEAGFGCRGEKKVDSEIDGFLFFYQDKDITQSSDVSVFDEKPFEEIFIDLPQEPATYAPAISTDEYIIEDQKHETGNHNHYFKDVSDIDEIDVYRVCDLFDVFDTSGAIHHAIKKLLCSGKRGVKDYRKDLEEARDSIQRKLDIMAEDGE